MNNISQTPATKEDINNVKKGLETIINDGQKQILKTLSEHSKTLSSHDEKFNKISETLSDHTKILLEHSKTLSDNSKTLADHSEQLAFIYEHGATKEELKEVNDAVERVADKTLDHDDRLRWFKENMFTKKDFEVFMNGQDKMMTILERLDKERIFTNRNIDTHEEKIEENSVKIKKYGIDIKKIKGVLKLSHS